MIVTTLHSLAVEQHQVLSLRRGALVCGLALQDAGTGTVVVIHEIGDTDEPTVYRNFWMVKDGDPSDNAYTSGEFLGVVEVGGQLLLFFCDPEP